MWQNSLGHCVLKAEFPKGKKELAVSLFQVGFVQFHTLMVVNSELVYVFLHVFAVFYYRLLF